HRVAGRGQPKYLVTHRFRGPQVPLAKACVTPREVPDRAANLVFRAPLVLQYFVETAEAQECQYLVHRIAGDFAVVLARLCGDSTLPVERCGVQQHMQVVRRSVRKTTS